MSKIFDRRLQSGFTLVELIVVIAILAILAGIAIPVYSNYVAKANQAADEQLIAAVNTAVAAAVLEARGEDMAKLDDGALSAISSAPIKVSDPTNAAVGTAFDKYFKGNETSSLKWYDSLAFENGVFVGVKNSNSNTILNASYTWHDYQAAAAAYNISNYKIMGVAGLTGTVDNLAGALSDYPQLFRVTQTGAFAETMDKLGIELSTADNATKANAAVFFVADQVSRMDVNEVLTALQNENLGTGDGLDDYLTNLGGLTSDDVIFLGTAIRYGIATSYVYSDFATSEEKAAFTSATPTNRAEAVALIRDATQGDGYLAYILDTVTDADTGSLEDTDAFFKILNFVSQNTDGFSSIEGSNLFSNTEVIAKIEELLGDNT